MSTFFQATYQFDYILLHVFSCQILEYNAVIKSNMMCKNLGFKTPFLFPQSRLWGHIVFEMSVCQSLIYVRSISPILFEVGIPNSFCECTLGSRSVTYYFRVTVTLTPGLNSRKNCVFRGI